jgi:AraC-like DNA-binding protein
MTQCDNRLSNPDILAETDIRSDASQTRAVRGEFSDGRRWLAEAPVCRTLNTFQIRHTGVAQMPSPFRIVRTHLGGSYFLGNLAGEGRVLVDGKWLASRPGYAFLLPPKTLHAFCTPEGKTWKFCWVRYQERDGQLPIARANSPVLAKFDATSLEHAIQGLHQECLTQPGSPLIEHWVSLVHAYVLRFAVPVSFDARLWRVWEQVAEELQRPWTIGQLARECHVSEKQFQRLCRRELGRNPQQHLMWLRMRKAAELLTQGNKKISAVAIAVGYQNPFVFSSTFKRIMGWSPSDYSLQNSKGSTTA